MYMYTNAHYNNTTVHIWSAWVPSVPIISKRSKKQCTTKRHSVCECVCFEGRTSAPCVRVVSMPRGCYALCVA